MSTLKEKIESYINPKGLIKTPAHYVKGILTDIVDKIDETVDKVDKTIDESIEEINQTLELTINTTIDLNIVPYVQNKIVFDTEELNIDIKNGYYYNENLLENLKITKSDDTICPKVEFNGYCIKLQLPKDVTLKDELVNFLGYATYILNFDNNNCKIDRYTWDLSNYLIATYSEGTTNLSNNNSLVFESLNRDRLLMTTGPVYKNERLITEIGTTISNLVFYNCWGLTSVEIPNSVTSIGKWAFGNCSRLTSITIPNSVTSIGESAFYGCLKLTSITIPNSVTTISDNAFYYCSGLTSVEIGSSVTSIGKWVFHNCSNLTSVIWNSAHHSDFEYDSSIAEINNPFYRIRTNITSFEFGDSVKHIPAYMCIGMSNLNTVEIPNSVTSIGSGAFYGCSGLTSVVIGNSVNNIGENTFYNCTGLASIEMGDSVTSIGKYAFYNCSGLTLIEIGDSITSIGYGAFNACSGLTSIVIPNLVTSIGGSAFYNCSKLTSITIYTIVPPELGSTSVFEGTSSNLIIYVPNESVDAYKTAIRWSSHSSKIKPISEKPV